MKKYPYIPEDTLRTLQEIGADEEQLETANKTHKSNIDRQLASHFSGSGTLPERPSGGEYDVTLVGLTGSGKSATANTILGQGGRFRVSSGAVSATIEEQVEHVADGNIKITVRDTPDSWRIGRQWAADIEPLYVLVVNLASPRFDREQLEQLQKVKDSLNCPLKNKRCLLLLTHAKEALHGQSLDDYLKGIEGDPLYELIVKHLEKSKVMAINNRCETEYEREKQRENVLRLIHATHKSASFDPDKGILQFISSNLARPISALRAICVNPRFWPLPLGMVFIWYLVMPNKYFIGPLSTWLQGVDLNHTQDENPSLT